VHGRVAAATSVPPGLITIFIDKYHEKRTISAGDT